MTNQEFYMLAPDAPAIGAGAPRTLATTFSRVETRVLLQQRVRSLRASVEEMLVAALVHALSQMMSGSRVLVDVQRPAVNGEVPAIVPRAIELSRTRSAADTLEHVKARLRIACPPDMTDANGWTRRAPIRVSYSGDSIGGVSIGGAIAMKDQPNVLRPCACYRLELRAVVTRARLKLAWIYDAHAYRRTTIECLRFACERVFADL